MDNAIAELKQGLVRWKREAHSRNEQIVEMNTRVVAKTNELRDLESQRSVLYDRIESAHKQIKEYEFAIQTLEHTVVPE